MLAVAHQLVILSIGQNVVTCQPPLESDVQGSTLRSNCQIIFSLEMVADWDALQNSFLEQVTKLAELAVADEALEKRIAAARTVRQV